MKLLFKRNTRFKIVDDFENLKIINLRNLNEQLYLLLTFMKIKKRKFNLLKIFSLKKVHWNESLKLSDRGIKFIESQRSLFFHHLIIQ